MATGAVEARVEEPDDWSADPRGQPQAERPKETEPPLKAPPPAEGEGRGDEVPLLPSGCAG